MDYSAEGRGANALQRVVFIIQYADGFSGDDFKNFDLASKEWRAELPRRSVSNAVLVQPNTLSVAYETEKIVGLSYEALMRDGDVEYGLRFDEKRILFMAGNYTRWNEIWPQARKHLERATGLVPEENAVTSYTVEYSDLFRAKGVYSDFEASGFLRMGSRFIPTHVFDRKENWHFHTGFFENFDEDGPYRVLTRVNADLKDNDEEKSRDLSIVLMHRIMAQREPWVGDIEVPDIIRERGLDNFASLHEIDKSILSEILNDEMADSIGLTS